MTTAHTLTSLLTRARDRAQGVRFIGRDEEACSFTYNELALRAHAVAGSLAALGVKRGDVVALVLPTAVSFYDAFFGTLLLGAVPAPLYPPVRLGRLDEYHLRTAAMLRASQAALVLTDARVRRLLGQAVERAAPRLGCVSVDALPGGDCVPAEVEPSGLALVQFSSGTTVDPKPVGLTHAQIIANIEAIHGAIIEALPETDGARHTAVSWLPLYHDMGLIGSVLTSLYHATDLTLIPPELFVARPAVWLRTVAKYRASVSAAPNFAYGLCAERISDADLTGVDLSPWRLALNGAEAVTPAALDKFVARFAPWGFRAEALTPVY
ncbi:MAG TPA: AMP-binding protein, partial [Myxococcota bacterium]|nr:AMP-binding protein [Myxococcota bacterium]